MYGDPPIFEVSPSRYRPRDLSPSFCLLNMNSAKTISSCVPINEPNIYSRAHLWPILYIAGMLGLWGENCQNMTQLYRSTGGMCSVQSLWARRWITVYLYTFRHPTSPSESATAWALYVHIETPQEEVHSLVTSATSSFSFYIYAHSALPWSVQNYLYVCEEV